MVVLGIGGVVECGLWFFDLVYCVDLVMFVDYVFWFDDVVVICICVWFIGLLLVWVVMGFDVLVSWVVVGKV